jgi:hypothetical protein
MLDKGGVIGAQGVLRNITDRIQNEAHSEELTRIVESSVNDIYVFDVESKKCGVVNKAARDNLGGHMGELRDMTPADLRPTDSGIAHDFNNMLQAIHLNVEKIVTDDSQQETWRDGALRAVGQGAQLRQRLLTFLRMQHLTPKVIDVNQSLREFEFLFRLTLTKSTNLELELNAHGAMLEGDRH